MNNLSENQERIDEILERLNEITTDTNTIFARRTGQTH